VSSVNSESLLHLYFEANSEEEWFQHAQAEAEFVAFSSCHLTDIIFELDKGEGTLEEPLGVGAADTAIAPEGAPVPEMADRPLGKLKLCAHATIPS
jgi:hypothetical protein